MVQFGGDIYSAEFFDSISFPGIENINSKCKVSMASSQNQRAVVSFLAILNPSYREKSSRNAYSYPLKVVPQKTTTQRNRMLQEL